MEYHIYMKLTIQIINKYMSDLALPLCTTFSIFQRKIMYSPVNAMTIINNYSKIVDTTTLTTTPMYLTKNTGLQFIVMSPLQQFSLYLS